MAFKCQACHKLSRFYPDLSFHRFPTNPETRKLWLAVLGLDENLVMKKRTAVCSDHFEARDFYYRSDNAKFLKRGVVPKPLNPFLFQDNSSSESTDPPSLHNSPVATRFPVNVERRNIWFSILAIDVNAPMPKNPLICSSHFKKSSFCYKSDGKKYLVQDAVPAEIERCNPSNDADSSAENSTQICNQEVLEDAEMSTTTTFTASETDNFSCKLEIEEPVLGYGANDFDINNLTCKSEFEDLDFSNGVIHSPTSGVAESYINNSGCNLEVEEPERNISTATLNTPIIDNPPRKSVVEEPVYDNSLHDPDTYDLPDSLQMKKPDCDLNVRATLNSPIGNDLLKKEIEEDDNDEEELDYRDGIFKKKGIDYNACRSPEPTRTVNNSISPTHRKQKPKRVRKRNTYNRNDTDSCIENSTHIFNQELLADADLSDSSTLTASEPDNLSYKMEIEDSVLGYGANDFDINNLTCEREFGIHAVTSGVMLDTSESYISNSKSSLELKETERGPRTATLNNSILDNTPWKLNCEKPVYGSSLHGLDASLMLPTASYSNNLPNSLQIKKPDCDTTVRATLNDSIGNDFKRKKDIEDDSDEGELDYRVGIPKKKWIDHYAGRLPEPTRTVNNAVSSVHRKQKPKRVRKRKAYVGDLTVEDFSTPEETEASLRIIKRKLVKDRTQIRMLQAENARLKNKIAKLTRTLKSGLLEKVRDKS